MTREADRNFADLLSLRCPSRAEELIAMLSEPRRGELRDLVAANSSVPPAELSARIFMRIAAAAADAEGLAAAAIENFNSLPPVLRKRLASAALSRRDAGRSLP